MRVRQSFLSKFMICPLQAKFASIEKIQERQNGKASFGTVIHYVLEQFNNGTNVETCLEMFKTYWDEPERLGVKPDYWPKYTSYGSLREKGLEMIVAYADKVKWEKRTILANEHSFCVPFGDHELQGTIDYLELKKMGNGKLTLRIVDLKTSAKAPTLVQLRQNVQFSVYIYATMQEEFWLGSQEYPGVLDGERWWKELQDVPRRGVWYHLMTNKEIDAGPRDDGDFTRLYRAVNEIEKSIERDVYVPNLSGDTCVWCAFTEPCGVTIPSGERDEDSF